MKRVRQLMVGICVVQFAVIILMCSACHTGVVVKATDQPSISREEAASIAVKEALRRGWREVEVGSVQFARGNWLVLVEQLPAVPGGHALIEVSSDGNIIHFVPGK